MSCERSDCDASAPEEARFCGYHARQCRDCDLLYGDHSGDLCPCCRHPVEHHDDEATAACWAGRKRMARARQAVGLALDDVDRQALGLPRGAAA